MKHLLTAALVALLATTPACTGRGMIMGGSALTIASSGMLLTTTGDDGFRDDGSPDNGLLVDGDTGTQIVGGLGALVGLALIGVGIMVERSDDADTIKSDSGALGWN